MARRRKNAFDLANGFGMASLHTGMTLWHRLPILAAYFTPQANGRHAGELTRMVSEKTAAVMDGAMEAQREILRLSIKAVIGRLDYKDMADSMATVTAAGMQPAFRTVKANSQRLSRRASSK